VSPDPIGHRLWLVVRPVDHFSGEPVADELPVRLAATFERPVLSPGGRAHRQDDGAYRFIGLRSGAVRVLWREPFARGHGPWVRWDDDPMVMLPLADPASFVEMELWPAAHAAAPASVTGVRGKLVGPSATAQTVRIALQGTPFDRYTRSDDRGDFLFLPPGRLPIDATGRVPMSIAVLAPDGTPRAVSGGSFVPDTAGAAFAGANFTLPPRVVSRVVFQLA
jgi:hypothetical protein